VQGSVSWRGILHVGAFLHIPQAFTWNRSQVTDGFSNPSRTQWPHRNFECAGLSPYHLQRTFKAVVGVTPREYADACRLNLLKDGLRSARSVTHAIHDAGFGSSSRVYERASTHLGMTPKQYRQGGKGMTISWATVDTALGLLMMAATDRGLCSVQIGDDQDDEGLAIRKTDRTIRGMDAGTERSPEQRIITP
jgi:AraC-like DNA-binding protein